MQWKTPFRLSFTTHALKTKNSIYHSKRIRQIATDYRTIRLAELLLTVNTSKI
ncbi:hypothetical protein ACJX0J_012494, partial [Zea mays]